MSRERSAKSNCQKLLKACQIHIVLAWAMVNIKQVKLIKQVLLLIKYKINAFLLEKKYLDKVENCLNIVIIYGNN